MPRINLANDSRAASGLFTPPWKLAVVTAILVLAFQRLNGGHLALPVWSAIAAITLTVATKWKLRRRPWFWAFMLTFGAVHTLAVVFAVRWQNWVSTKGFVLLVVLDWLLMVGVISSAGKMIGTVPQRAATERRA